MPEEQFPHLLPQAVSLSGDKWLIDVRLMASRLPAEQSKLRKDAERFLDFHSCSSDIRLAYDYVAEAIEWHGNKAASAGYAKTTLMQSAVSLYARAFDQKSRHRRAISIKSRLDARAAAFHDQLIDLRHESLSHFGPAGTAVPWSEDFAFMLSDGVVWQPFVVARRSQFEPVFAAELLQHLALTSEISSALAVAERDKFQTRMQAEWAESEALHALMQTCRADPAIVGGWDGPILGGNRSGRKIIEMVNPFGNA